MGNCQPFAIMRLTHEAIRFGLNEIEALTSVESPNLEALRAKYAEVKRVIELHAKQEEEVFYKELAKKMEGVTASFSEEHAEEKAMFEKLDILSVSSDKVDVSKFIQTLKEWLLEHRAHLVHEEQGLMKLLPQAFTYVESVGVVRKIIAHDLVEFENYQLSWVYDRLNKKQQEMYLGMLKYCSPEGKFETFQKEILR